MKLSISVLLFFLCTAISNTSFASDNQTNLDIYTEIGLENRYINGDTTYRISFEDTWDNGGHGESELEFPFDNYMSGIRINIGSRDKKNNKLSRGIFKFSYLSSIDKKAGKMKDSDWIENDAAYDQPPHPGLDLYTESDAEYKGTMIDISYGYNFMITNSWVIGPLLRYRYHKAEYDIYGLSGYYYTSPVSGTEKALEYEIKYNIPYVGLDTTFIFGKKQQFEINLNYAFSDWANAKDIDNHILRSKESKGDCEGESYMANINLAWKLASNWTISLGGSYMDIDTRGTQTQKWYAAPFLGAETDDIDDKITSRLWSGSLTITYRFNNQINDSWY